MSRLCSFCRKEKRTTNRDNPYICRKCYRSKGRELLLAITTKLAWKGAFWLILLFAIGFTIGYFV